MLPPSTRGRLAWGMKWAMMRKRATTGAGGRLIVTRGATCGHLENSPERWKKAGNAERKREGKEGHRTLPNSSKVASQTTKRFTS